LNEEMVNHALENKKQISKDIKDALKVLYKRKTVPKPYVTWSRKGVQNEYIGN